MIDGETVRWLGVVLGNRFRGLVAIQSGHALVTSGIYGVIRPPSYLGLLIGSQGWLSVGSRRGFSHSFLFRFSWPGSVQKRTY
jgi:protein-S-isoprenylcysteine O-methyltransferase Ste14